MRNNTKRIITACTLIIFLAILSVSVLVSCGKGTGTSSPDTQNQAELPYEISVVKDSAEELSGIKGNITLMYPQMNYPGNEAAADKINGLIKNLAVSVFKEAGLESDDIESYMYVTETALITLKKENFFSAVVTGYYITDTASHQEYFSYSVNCDISQEKLLTSEDIITNFEKIRALFIDGKFTQSYGEETLLDETTHTDIFTQYKADYSIYPDVYFTSSSFGVIVEIVYHLGGNACFEIPYSDVKEYLNADLPVFK